MVGYLATANWLAYVLCIALGSGRDRNLGAPQLNPLLLFFALFLLHSVIPYVKGSLALTDYTTGTTDGDDTIYKL